MATVMERPTQENGNRNRIGHLLRVSMMEWDALPATLKDIEEENDSDATAAYIEDALEMLSRFVELRNLHRGAEMDQNQQAAFELLDVMVINLMPRLTGFFKTHKVTLRTLGDVLRAG